MVTKLDDAIKTYLSACEVEGKSPRTIESYAESLRDFRRAGDELGLPVDPHAYGVAEAYSYLGHVRARAGRATYQHRRHREVRTFFSWCRRVGLVDDNPFQRIPLVRLEQVVIEPFTADEIARLLGALDLETHTGARNTALILLLLDTGVRASECVQIELADIDWDRRRILIRHAKGGKERWVAFSVGCEVTLRRYVRMHRGATPGALFLASRTRRPLLAGALNTIFDRLGRRSGVERVHPHRFRHTFATHCIRAGAREVDVQRLLGHSSLAMVQRYSQTYSSEEAVRAHASFSPVAALVAKPDLA